MEQGSDEVDGSHFNSSEDLPPFSSSSKVMKKAVDNSRLPSDVFSIISEKLDFDDLISSSEVCKNWRTSYTIFWGHFMAAQAPLVIQMTKRSKSAFSFFSISDGKTYNTKLPRIRGLFYSELSYAGFSSGYLIMANTTNNTLLLVNPFTRRMKHIPEPTYQGDILSTFDRAILAFAVDSEEFVIVAPSVWSFCLNVYQSRNSRWVRYSIGGKPWIVVDAVVLHRTVYAITGHARIGVLSLNSPSLKLLQLSNTPNLYFFDAKLVNSDGELLVVYFPPSKQLEVFRIDFSKMEWVKLETLGDRALFWGVQAKCYALSNPGRWGYDSNCVYYIDERSLNCKVYSMNNELVKNISPIGNRPRGSRAKLFSVDWCFRHLRDEVDYSLDE